MQLKSDWGGRKSKAMCPWDQGEGLAGSRTAEGPVRGGWRRTIGLARGRSLVPSAGATSMARKKRSLCGVSSGRPG